VWRVEPRTTRHPTSFKLGSLPPFVAGLQQHEGFVAPTIPPFISKGTRL
jgi:hypothetical protein